MNMVELLVMTVTNGHKLDYFPGIISRSKTKVFTLVFSAVSASLKSCIYPRTLVSELGICEKL